MTRQSGSENFIGEGGQGAAWFLLFYIVPLFVVWSVRATVLYSMDESLDPEFWRAAYSSAVKFFVWVVPAFIYAAAVENRNPFRYLKLTSRTRVKGLIYALLACEIFFTGVIAFEQFVSGKDLSALANAPDWQWLSTLLAVSASSVSEEILFRGLVLTKLQEDWGFWPANLVSSLLFTLIHWPYWLWSEGFSMTVVSTSVSIYILSLLLGYLVKLSNSLWPAVGAHILNNFLASYLRG